eukprot:TRINITY_DN6880_c1_g1_i1.p1 TRINITY_DN6880_c1_g1~~TRINITY_DN6880_c1_g1_i1.p1  ORF type:complete len:321 (-),score=42.04 TRINITY_DN6880_c1_g1_i1:29-991(-)
MHVSSSSIPLAAPNMEYKYTSYGIGVVDITLTIVALVQLLRILIHERRYAQSVRNFRMLNPDEGPKQASSWSGKKAFHLIILLCMFDRGTFFLVTLPLNTLLPDTIETLWIQSGSLLFLVAYFMLLMFWAKFYYSIRGIGREMAPKLERAVNIIFVGSVVALIGFLIVCVVFLKNDQMAPKLDTIAGGVVAGMELTVGAGFFYFGIKLALLARQFHLLSSRKRAQTSKVVTVAAGCTLCFITRSVLILYSMYNAWNLPYARQFDAPWYVVLIFFLVLETIPVTLMLFLLRKLPTVKGDQYSEDKPLCPPVHHSGHVSIMI